MTTYRREGSRSRLAWLSAGIATLFLAGQLGGFVHELVVQHVTCPEHGEVIHLPADLSQGTASEPTSSNGLAGGEGWFSDHGGEGCIVLLDIRERALSSSASGHLVAPAGSEAGAATSPLVAFDPVSGYRIAPKQSPPA